MFEQRIQSQTADQYYFQLSPSHLNIKTSSVIRSLKTGNKVFRLKLVKGPQLSDQSKKSTPGKPLNGKIPFERTQLNFYLPSYNPNRNIEYNIILLQGEQGSDKQQEIGNYTLMSGDYIKQFLQHRARLFTETIDLSQDYSLSLEIFLNNSRYGLQKFVRETKEQRKQETRNNVVNKQERNETPKINRTKSEVNSESSRGEIISGENRFMSPSRRIVRKKGNEKQLLMRSGSPARSQRSGGSRTSSQNQNIKFISGRDGRGSPKRDRPTLAQQEIAQSDKRKEEELRKKKILEQDARATRQIEKKRDEEARKRDQQKRNDEEIKKKELARQKVEDERRKIDRQQNQGKQLEKSRQNRRISQEQKVDSSSGSKKIFFVNPAQKIQSQKNDNPLSIKSIATSKNQDKTDWEKTIKIKRTESTTEGQYIMKGSGLHTKKAAQLDIKTIAIYVVFLVISFLLIVKAMTPSSKV